jgi:hypothetical protein
MRPMVLMTHAVKGMIIGITDMKSFVPEANHKNNSPDSSVGYAAPVLVTVIKF